MVERARINNHGQLIWAIADLLRGDYKQSEYGRAILPLVLLRRLDCVLEPTKLQVRGRLASLEGRVDDVGPVLQAIAGIEVYNTSPLTLKKILADPSQVAPNLRAWIAAFDEDPRCHREVRLRRPDRAARPGHRELPAGLRRCVHEGHRGPHGRQRRHLQAHPGRPGVPGHGDGSLPPAGVRGGAISAGGLKVSTSGYNSRQRNATWDYTCHGPHTAVDAAVATHAPTQWLAGFERSYSIEMPSPRTTSRRPGAIPPGPTAPT